jgi:hypothetical protein
MIFKICVMYMSKNCWSWTWEELSNRSLPRSLNGLATTCWKGASFRSLPSTRASCCSTSGASPEGYRSSCSAWRRRRTCSQQPAQRERNALRQGEDGEPGQVGHVQCQAGPVQCQAGWEHPEYKAAIPRLRFNHNHISGAISATLLILMPRHLHLVVSPSYAWSFSLRDVFSCSTQVHMFQFMYATSTCYCLFAPFLYVHSYADRIYSTSFLSLFPTFFDVTCTISRKVTTVTCSTPNRFSTNRMAN